MLTKYLSIANIVNNSILNKKFLSKNGCSRLYKKFRSISFQAQLHWKFVTQKFFIPKALRMFLISTYQSFYFGCLISFTGPSPFCNSEKLIPQFMLLNFQIIFFIHVIFFDIFSSSVCECVWWMCLIMFP